VLGVSEGTVKSRLFHARQKLAKMKGEGEHGSE
jgi:DNA-directed RNA polymerase specialized sigma24 family protein